MPFRRGWSAALLFCLAALGAGCDDGDAEQEPTADAGPPDAAADVGADAEIEVDAGGDGLPGAPPAGQWIEVEPGGETVCSRGTPYRFFVRGGDPNKVIVDFQGGGACWNTLTCSFAGQLFRPEAAPLSAYQGAIDSGSISGLPDPDSPFADWTLIHVQYCSGDIHWGDARVEYSDAVVIEHRGWNNARSAIDWMQARYAPDQLLVSGCSAGAYGAIFHGAWMAHEMPDSRVTVVADSGAGIITDSFLQDSLPGWNAQSKLPPFIPALDVPIVDLSLPEVYVAVAETFPEHTFAQVTSQFDADQTFFFEAMGGDPAEWPLRLNESLAYIEERAPNFRSYVTPGSMHCSTPYPFLFERTVDGVSQIDWLAGLVDAEEAPPSVRCSGEGCFDDPVCEACASTPEGEEPAGWCRFCDGWPDRYRPAEEQPGDGTP